MAEEYRKAGIRRESVDTGAIIITGETSRKENARAVLDALSDFAGEFVVATAGPDLESVLAAKGAGAVDYSQRTGKTVLHMDIGGGTSNLALIRDGKIERTGCLNVGGRLLKFDDGGTVTYVSPVLSGLCDLKPGDKASHGQVKTVAEILTRALEMAAGLREETPLLEQLTTREAGRFDPCREKGLVVSFSGSTVFHQNVPFPLKNVPVVSLADISRETIRRELSKQEDSVILAFPGMNSPGYREVAAMAEEIAAGTGGNALICLEQDMAKALGQALALRLGCNAQILCIDRVKVSEGSYLDVGAPVGPALPVVVKTLVLGK